MSQKSQSVPPFTFFGTMRLTGNFIKISKKKSDFSFSIFSFLRAFVVSSCRKSGFRFRVLLSFRYGADLGRSRLVMEKNCKKLLYPIDGYTLLSHSNLQKFSLDFSPEARFQESCSVKKCYLTGFWLY